MLNDDELMQQVAEDKPSIFKLMIERYQEKALRFCYRLIGDYQLAEDATQETFVRIYESRKNYKASGNFNAFFYTIMNNICLDFIRRASANPVKTNKPMNNPGFEEIPIASGSPSPLQTLVLEENGRLIRETLDSLPYNYRQALILKELEGLKYREIAETMRITIDEVKVYIHRARNQLADKIGGLLKC